MSKFISPAGVTFSVEDGKDERYLAEGHKLADEPKKAPAKKAASSKSEK